MDQERGILLKVYGEGRDNEEETGENNLQLDVMMRMRMMIAYLDTGISVKILIVMVQMMIGNVVGDGNILNSKS
jgi:hypothetical protein